MVKLKKFAPHPQKRLDFLSFCTYSGAGLVQYRRRTTTLVQKTWLIVKNLLQTRKKDLTNQALARKLAQGSPTHRRRTTTMAQKRKSSQMRMVRK